MNPRWFLFLLIAVFLMGNHPAAQADPVLERITASLAQIVHQLSPKAGMGSSEHTLMVSYQAQPFKVPDRSMTGVASGKVHDEIGPGPRGFVLRVDVQDLGTVNQAVTPQTLKEAFWQTDIDVVPVAGTRKQIFWGLSYGKETNPRVLAEIKAVLKQLAQPVK